MTKQLNIAQSRTVEALLSDIGLGIVVTDILGAVMFFNKAATKVLGVELEQTALADWPLRYGMYLPDGITLCPSEQFPLKRAIDGEEVDNVEMFIVAPSASAPDATPGDTALGRFCNINLRPLKNDTGKVEGAVLVLQDITDRKKLADEAARSNEALQQFAVVAAHDLQEPLRSMAVFVDLLSEEADDQLNGDCKHYLTRIRDGVKRMRSLITDVLAFSRINRASTLKQVNVNVVLEKCIDGLSASIAETGAKVIFNRLPIIVADGAQLAQLFQNLLGNALKFAAKGRPPVVQIDATRQLTNWLFSVKDNGIGIEMEYAERIFVLFQRLHNLNEYSGTGIGLAICKRIVTGHRGRIWMESQPGQGSTFYFTIPVRVSPGGTK